MQTDRAKTSKQTQPDDRNRHAKELVRQTLAGQPAARAVAGPLAVHYCARLAGVSLRDYTLNPQCLAESVIRYYERFRPDAIWLSADTWVTAEAMGAAVAFPGPNQPLAGTGEPAVRTAADIDRIPPPDPSKQGRCPLMLDALRRIKQAIGPETFIVACFDQYPFSLACALMGIEQVMVRIVEDRAMVEALMEKCCEYTTAYALALAEAGADMLSGGDSPAGLIGPRLYREVALPYEMRVIANLKARLADTQRDSPIFAGDGPPETARWRRRAPTEGWSGQSPSRCTFAATPCRSWPTWRPPARMCWSWITRSISPRRFASSGRRSRSGAISIPWDCSYRDGPNKSAKP